jgi:hypothetical protein
VRLWSKACDEKQTVQQYGDHILALNEPLIDEYNGFPPMGTHRLMHPIQDCPRSARNGYFAPSFNPCTRDKKDSILIKAILLVREVIILLRIKMHNLC